MNSILVEEMLPKKILFSVFIFVSASFCTNFTTEDVIVNTPIILGISLNPSGGHILKIAAQNTEIGFAGYRLYAGTTEQAVRTADPASGIDCSQPLSLLPSQGIEYKIEIVAGKGAPAKDSGYICNFPVTLTAGNFIGMRAVKIQSITSLTTGLSSNVVVVP